MQLTSKLHDDKPLPTERVELIGIDLDGTLLRDDNTPSVAAAQAIHEAVEAGVKVVIVTARPWRGTKAIYEGLGLDTIVVNHNGAVIYDPIAKELIQHNRLSGELAKQVVQLARHVDPEIGVGVEVLNQFFVDRLAKRLRAEPELGMTDEKPNPFDELYQHAITKVALVGDSGSLGGVQMALNRVGQGRVSIAYSNVRLLQVMHPFTSKATGLEFAANYYGVPQERVMAIGDAPNDVPMVEWAGLGIAMGNAWPDVRKAAQFVVPSNEDDGVAVAIRRYGLI